MGERLVVAAIVLSAISGVPGLFLRQRSMAGQWLSTILAASAAAAGFTGVGSYWAGGDCQAIHWALSLPGAEFSVAIDGLTAFFLIPIFLILLLGSIYGLGYWNQAEHADNGRKLRFFYGALAAGMALVVMARNGVLFVFAWEIMAVSAFFLVTTEDDKSEAREAGWIYLVATHVATLCLFALFALLRYAGGSFALAPVAAESLSPGIATAIFILALVGFGLKAGIMPLHVWLPSSHAIAPSHVSAIMSGVIIKMGIYGLVRITSLLPAPPVAWGAIVLGLGIASGVLGVANAIGQHDLKRLLAYHSIENIGIIVMGLGLALLGRSLGRAEWVVLGLSGALLHVWNHALFKALLFLSAGSVIHATRTREIDHLGGLAKSMRWTSSCFLVGAVAICGLPPLNGFVSEFLIYIGLFGAAQNGTGTAFVAAAFAIPALALIGALALACFVKVFGAVFLGNPRTEPAAGAHESPPSMLGPAAALVACCTLIGLAPMLVAPALTMAVADWASGLPLPALQALAPLDWVARAALLLVVGLVGLGLLYWLRLRRSAVAAAPTWGCGYAAATPRMQYTASSFAQMLVGLFSWALRPRRHEPADLPLFPGKSEFHSEAPDAVLDEAVLPGFHLAASAVSRLRVIQHGSTQSYLLYIVVALLALLLWR